MTAQPQRLVFGISGASGIPLAQNALRHINTGTDLEVHLIVSEGARRVMEYEGRHDGNNGSATRPEDLLACVAANHSPSDLAAPPASGTWPALGMVVCPCSMSTLASIATGVGHNLIHRAADVTLKERRPLILVVRETPLSLVHLRNMQAATEAGVTIMPFCPAFYAGNNTLEQMERYFTGRILDQLRVPHKLCEHRWGEALPTN